MCKWLTNDRISWIRINISNGTVTKIVMNISTSHHFELTENNSYTQLIPAIFISVADAAVTSSVNSVDPVAANAIAPGLSMARYQMKYTTWQTRNQTTDNCVPLPGVLKADTRPINSEINANRPYI